MKKAKPSKGSARTKRFLDGGAVGALAGLGTLAYLMSRKKKGESEGSAPKDKSGYSSGPVDVGRMIEGRGDEEPSAEVKRAMATSQGRPDLIPEGADEAVMRSDNYATPKPKAAVKKAAAKPVAKSVVKTAEKQEAPEKVATQSFPISTAGKANVDLPSKPYPKDAKGTEKPKKRGGIGPYHAFEGVTDYFSKLREGRKRPGETQVAGMKKGGSVSSASKRADGIAQRGKTKGRIC